MCFAVFQAIFCFVYRDIVHFEEPFESLIAFKTKHHVHRIAVRFEGHIAQVGAARALQ